MHWLYREFSDTWFVILRRALGVILLASCYPLLFGEHRLFGTTGLFDPQLLQLHPQAFGYSIYQLTAAMDQLWAFGLDEALALLMGVYLLLCLALIVGIEFRIAALGLLFLHHAFFVAAPIFSYGFDYLALSALAYCVCYTKRQATPLLRCLQLHLCIVYFFGGLNKVLGPTWHNGEALWKALQQPIGAASLTLPAHLGAYPQVWVVAGWGIVLLELAYAPLVWYRHTRRWVIYGVVAMHLGIALLMGLYAFSALMVLLNLVAFYYPYLQSLTHPASTGPIQAIGDPVTPMSNPRGKPGNQSSSYQAGVPLHRPP